MIMNEKHSAYFVKRKHLAGIDFGVSSQKECIWHWSHYTRLRVQTDFLDCVFPIVLINKHSIYGKVI